MMLLIELQDLLHVNAAPLSVNVGELNLAGGVAKKSRRSGVLLGHVKCGKSDQRGQK